MAALLLVGSLVLSLTLVRSASAASTGVWTLTGSMNVTRIAHTATLLPNGKVLVAGGYIGNIPAELYDPGTGAWTPTGAMNVARQYHTATLLPNGKVLVAGGEDSTFGGITASAELYDPSTGAWTLTGSLHVARWYHTATLLPNGRVLVAGGQDSNNFALASAEQFSLCFGLLLCAR
jgi:N-acetylneuraminic acid mutarotase